MDYHKAYIELYGAAGKALDLLKEVHKYITSPQTEKAYRVLQQAVIAVENMDSEKPGEG
jgi:hypothetical protein